MAKFVYPTRKANEVPSLIAGNRLEPRPRSVEFNRSLRAEVRDASWLLARQWQMKEFRAEDRGSPIGAEVELRYAPLTHVRPGVGRTGPAAEYDRMALPLDALVEARTPVVDLGLQLQMGRHWKKLLQNSALSKAQVDGLLGTYRQLHPVKAIADGQPYSLEYAVAQTQPEALAIQTAAAGRAIAGHDLYEWLLANPGTAAFVQHSSATSFSVTEQKELSEIANLFVAWYRRIYSIPSGAPLTTWSVPDLTYQFTVAAPASDRTRPMALKAREHPGGELNWYTVDEDAQQVDNGLPNDVRREETTTLHFLPTEIQFAGAPNARWWEFEDRKVDFGQITADSSDFGRMLLQEFMFLYHNDWFSVPYSVPAGSICSVTKLVVTDVFGESYGIKAAGDNSLAEPEDPKTALENDWGRWSLFALSTVGNRRLSTPHLLLAPTALNAQVGPVVEQVYFAREEATNLVWGVEKVVPNGMGRGTDGDSAAARLTEYLRSRAPAATPLVSGARLEYKLANPVAENWIPFIPRPSGSGNLYELEQGTMLRQVDYLNLVGPDRTVEPRTELLGGTFAGPYLLHEREIPPTGIRVEGAFRRTRWYNGGAILWYGRNRNVGRSGGSSGLVYDQLIPRPARDSSGARTSAAGSIGVVNLTRNEAGAIDSIQGYRLDEQDQPVGNLLQIGVEQLVDLLLAKEQVVVVRPSETSAWQVDESVVLVSTNGNYSVQLASEAEPPQEIGIDPLVDQHLRRVKEQGGQFVDEAFLVRLVKLLRELDLTERILHLSDVRLGCQLNEQGGVNRLFCLGGHDAVATPEYDAPQYVEKGWHDKPELRFRKSGLIVKDFDLSQSNSFSLVTLLRQSDTGAMLVSRPTPADDFMVYSMYGQLRCRHNIYYNGQELVADGESSQAGWLTLAVRYNIDRTEGQLAGTVYSVPLHELRQLGYSYNLSREKRLERAPLTLGFRGGEEPLFTEEGAIISVCFLRDYDDEKGVNQLRDLLQEDYIQ